MSSGATEAAGAVVQGLRRHGGDWAQTRECALLVVKVLRDGEAHDVLTVTAALRRYRVAQAARRAVARHAPRAQRRALTGRRLTGRELVAALLAWAERGEEAHLRGDRVEVEARAMMRWVALLGDCPARVVRVLRAAGLLEAEPGELGVRLRVRIPAEALGG